MHRPVSTPLMKAHTYLNQIYGQLHQLFVNNTLLILSVFGFALVGLFLWLLTGYYHQQQALFIDSYGNALNQLAADQLTVSMSNNNLIGLQSILNNLINQTQAVNAVVYGVDNKIIVQAGQVNALELGSFKAYTSPIALDDALLGSLTINIDHSTSTNYIFPLIILALIASLLALLLQRNLQKKLSNTFGFIQTSGTETQAETAIDMGIKTGANNASMETKTTEAEHQTLLLLECHTLDKLYQQLNAEARNREFNKLQTAIQKILTLYSGKKIAATANTLLISFNDKDNKTCLFNALCCAHLLKQSSQQQQWLIQFSNFIYDGKEDIELDDFAQLRSLYNHKDNTGIIVKQSLITSNQLTERLRFASDTETDYIFIQGFAGTYENLINSQLSHII